MSAQKASAPAAAPAPEILNLCSPGELADRTQIYQRITCRAHQLFEARGRESRRDLQDWLEAEAEFLRPVPVLVRELAEKVIVRADVPGFALTELKASVEPHRITIAGRKTQDPEREERISEVDRQPNEILRVVMLPAEVNPKCATAKLHEGVLEFDLPKELRWEATEIGC
jgi:HSP20 family molecular chaperone IbpA